MELKSLTAEDFERILTEPRNALTLQYQALLDAEGVKLSFTESSIREIARTAAEVNDAMENIGARRLHTIMTRLLDDILFDVPDVDHGEVVLDADDVRRRLQDVVQDTDLRKYIL